MRYPASPTEKSQFIWIEDKDGDGFVALYERDLEIFYSQLIELNVDIYIIDHILQFPIKLFSDDNVERSIFLVQVVDNFLDQSILTITKLITDQDKGEKKVHTLTKFKNEVIKHLRAEYRDDFMKLLRKSAFENKTSRLLKKAQRIRNKRIAHFDQRFFRESFSQALQSEYLLFSEIKALRDELNAFFEVLSFDAECEMLPNTYKNNTSDIEWILDCIARSSNILNMPEDKPDWWQNERQRLTEDEVYQLNHYRKKFGLQEV